MSVLEPIVCSDFYKLCLEVCGQARLPMHNFYRSKKTYNNFVHVFLLTYKERLNVSYRRFIEIAEENNLQRMLCIKRIPHFTTIQKALQRLPKSLLERMVRACKKLLNLKNIEASVDGTGFSNTNPSQYYTDRIDAKTVKNYTKTVFLTDNKTKLILNIRTHSDRTNETIDFIPLVKELKNTLSTILADKGYDSTKNRKYCWDNNIENHIPLREWKQNRKNYGHKPHYNKQRKKASKLFNQTKYHNRALIESVNSAIKRTLGGWVCSRKPENQQKQATIKALAYNLEHIGRTIKIKLFINTQGILQSQRRENLY